MSFNLSVCQIEALPGMRQHDSILPVSIPASVNLPVILPFSFPARLNLPANDTLGLPRASQFVGAGKLALCGKHQFVGAVLLNASHFGSICHRLSH